MKPLLRTELENGQIYLCLLSGKYMIVTISEKYNPMSGNMYKTYIGYYFSDGFRVCDIVDNQLVAPNFENKE